ncbi:hypothetical protein [Streptomyces bauhiniae]|uniref:Alpha/beta hydrolase n=1 Tax=Streptomyces bauhiniae TaxID=2340725 RepID=A0A7K3QUI0_9ACTN|nr:hypothetical protein [Streptomyces bauhiniae]NEB93511.1 hypothetical protein [Streptomyces bauhiniae]
MTHHQRTEIVTNERSGVEVLIEGAGPPVALVPSYGRDGGADFDDFAEHVAAGGFTVIWPQPRGTAGSTGVVGATWPHLGDLRKNAFWSAGAARLIEVIPSGSHPDSAKPASRPAHGGLS